MVSAKGSGQVAEVATTFGKNVPVPGVAAGALGSVSDAFTPAAATNALDIDVTFAHDALVLRAPSVTMTYNGTAAEGTRPTRVFAQLVDPVSNLVLGTLVTPIEVETRWQGSHPYGAVGNGCIQRQGWRQGDVTNLVIDACLRRASLRQNHYQRVADRSADSYGHETPHGKLISATRRFKVGSSETPAMRITT